MWGIFSRIKEYRFKKLPFWLIGTTVSLAGIGVVAVGSAQPDLQGRQFAGALLGIGLMHIFALVDYRMLISLGWWIYAACVLLLSLTRILGDAAGGATRWLDLGFIRFQPSEIVKIGLILFFAFFFEKERERENQRTTLLFAATLAGVLLVLILTQPDLSTTIVTGSVFLTILFLSGIRLRLLVESALILLPVGGAALFLLQRIGVDLFGSYQLNRILAWMNPEDYVQESWQQQNSIMAIGSGGLFGKGLYNEGAFSVKNGNYIPEPQTDFIMAILGEELGFCGSAAVIFLLFLTALLCQKVGCRANSYAGKLFCTGYGFLIAVQGFVNLGVVSGLLPNTGLTLPFVSYGLSSLCSLFLGAGVVLNIGINRR